MNSPRDLVDASAVLALLGEERGSEPLRTLVPGGTMSAVNVSEVLDKLVRRGMTVPEAKSAVSALHLQVLPFGIVEALHTADFVHPNISLGDRACLGTAQAGGYRVITGESKWLDIRRGVDVFLFRDPRSLPDGSQAE